MVCEGALAGGIERNLAGLSVHRAGQAEFASRIEKEQDVIAGAQWTMA